MAKLIKPIKGRAVTWIQNRMIFQYTNEIMKIQLMKLSLHIGCFE